MLYLYDSRKKIACVVGALVLACTAGYYFFHKQEDQLVLYGNVDVRQVRFARLLHMTGLAQFTERLAGKLSGGMKQSYDWHCCTDYPYFSNGLRNFHGREAGAYSSGYGRRFANSGGYAKLHARLRIF